MLYSVSLITDSTLQAAVLANPKKDELVDQVKILRGVMADLRDHAVRHALKYLDRIMCHSLCTTTGRRSLQLVSSLCARDS